MNEKLTLDDLSNHIMFKHNIAKEDSGRFLTSFLKVVVEGLICDRYVRIKGLGTFKLIEDNIDNHSSGNIVFVPESALKDVVNKPFAHFESVILNENVNFDDVKEHVLSNNPVSETDVEENISNNIVTDNEVNTEEKDVFLSNEAEICIEHSEVDENNIDNRNDNELLNRNLDEKIRLEAKVSTVQHSHNIRWYIILTLFIGFLLGAFASWLLLDNKTLEPKENYVSNSDFTENTVVESVTKTVIADSTINSETFVEDATTESDIVKKAEIDSILKAADIEKKENEKRNIDVYSEKSNYRIVGTLETHIIKKGSTLAKIAYKYYKNKRMWPYIVMHNKEKIKDPNNVPIDTEINIPKLEVIE